MKGIYIYIIVLRLIGNCWDRSLYYNLITFIICDESLVYKSNIYIHNTIKEGCVYIYIYIYIVYLVSSVLFFEWWLQLITFIFVMKVRYMQELYGYEIYVYMYVCLEVFHMFLFITIDNFHICHESSINESTIRVWSIFIYIYNVVS